MASLLTFAKGEQQFISYIIQTPLLMRNSSLYFPIDSLNGKKKMCNNSFDLLWLLETRSIYIKFSRNIDFVFSSIQPHHHR